MKRKLIKESVASAFSVTLLAGALAGCGNSGQTAGQTTDDKTPLNITISMSTVGNVYVQNSPDINKDPYVQQLEKMTNTNLNIQLIPHPQFANKMDLTFASGNIPDVVQIFGGYGGTGNGQSLNSAIDAGQFLPLDDLINKYAPDLKQKIPADAWTNQTYKDGHIYSIPDYLLNPSRRATVIRMDLLKKANLPVPKTVADTLNVLRAFKAMGVESPYIGRASFKYADTFFGAYDVLPEASQWTFDSNGNPIPKWFNTTNMEQALNVYKTMYDQGLIRKEFLTDDSNMQKNLAVTGKGGMWSMNANELLAYQQQLQQNVPGAELAIIPSPTGPDGSGGYYLYSSVVRAYMINKNAKDPARIIKFLDWMLSPDAEKFFTYGTEGQDYTMQNGVVNYKQPTTSDETLKESYRTNWLWLLHDETYTKGLLSLTPAGKNLMSAYDTILAKEGRDGIRFNPPLEAYTNIPDLQDASDQPSKFLLGHMAKMVTGAEPIDSWQTVIDQWKKQGGDKVLAEAATAYKNKQYFAPRRQATQAAPSATK